MNPRKIQKDNRIRSLLFITLFFLLGSVMLTACADKDTVGFPAAQLTDRPKTDEAHAVKKRIKMGVTFLGDFEYIKKLKNNLKIEAENHHIDLIVYEGKASGKTQLNNVLDMIQNKVDLIVLNPVDAAIAAEAVGKAAEANIPVVGINTLANTDLLTSYIGSNDIQAGEMELQFIAEKLNGRGNIVILQGLPEQSSQIQRTQGINNMLEKYPNIRVLEQQTAKWSEEEAYQLMKAWYAKYGERIHGVVSHNDEMALGAVKFLKEIGMQRKISVIGVDGIERALQAVKDGDLAATVFQNAQGQAKLAVKIAEIISQNGEVAKSYLLPYQLITKENVDFYTH